MTSDGPRPLPLPASSLLTAIDNPDAHVFRILSRIYGGNRQTCRERLHLVRRVLEAHIRRFGDQPVRLFRCPGRINLRGMHVDTHGGYLNLMTHQREVVVSMSPRNDNRITVANIDPAFNEAVIWVPDASESPAQERSWLQYITSPESESLVAMQRGDWSNYVRGSVMRVVYRSCDAALGGFDAVVGSDIPRGAALSSSAALCLGLISAALARAGHVVPPEDLIVMAQDAEWYTGSRCGRSDQAAEVLGRVGSVVNLSLVPFSDGIRLARFAEVPDTVRILVIDSCTTRSISGRQAVEYTRNRFAYSVAMEIARQEAVRGGIPREHVSGMATLADFSPSRLDDLGGAGFLFTLLRSIPEAMSLEDLRRRYALPGLDADFERYFGSLPDLQQPETFNIRGPLLFGIAESERARLFYEHLVNHNWRSCGKLMSIGHDGDRRVTADGTAYGYEVSDSALERLGSDRTPIALCAGAYGASTPALDALVDTAMHAGALGASLTGAGIAGVVLALCRAEHAETVANGVRELIGSERYARLRGVHDVMNKAETAEAVIVNCAPSSVGELRLAPSL